MYVHHGSDWPRFRWDLGKVEGARTTHGAVLDKATFWQPLAGISINDRQRLVLNRLVDGLEGKLTTSKYAKVAKCSPDTALRDIQYLVARGVLTRNPQGGRSTSYVPVNFAQ